MPFTRTCGGVQGQRLEHSIQVAAENLQDTHFARLSKIQEHPITWPSRLQRKLLDGLGWSLGSYWDSSQSLMPLFPFSPLVYSLYISFWSQCSLKWQTSGHYVISCSVFRVGGTWQQNGTSRKEQRGSADPRLVFTYGSLTEFICPCNKHYSVNLRNTQTYNLRVFKHES